MALKPETFTDVMLHVLHGKRYERVKRIKDMDHVPRGMRNQPVHPRYVGHKYAIKNGISSYDVLARTVYSVNPLYRALLSP